MDNNKTKFKVKGNLYSFNDYVGYDEGETVAVSKKKAIRQVEYQMKRKRGLPADSKLEFKNPEVIEI